MESDRAVREVRKELEKLADEGRAAVSKKFFKTGPGEYGEGDKFLGIRVPVLRKLSKRYQSLDLGQTLSLLRSEIHEERLLALFILVLKYSKGSGAGREDIYNLYLNNVRFVNNWDLVDASAEHIMGSHLKGGDKSLLFDMASTGGLWERRIAIMSTFHLIKQNEFDDALRIAEILLTDEEDLIHKAVGWMLREIGKRNLKKEEAFLKKYYGKMPRTMLRYAIEKFPDTRRQAYLKGVFP